MALAIEPLRLTPLGVLSQGQRAVRGGSAPCARCPTPVRPPASRALRPTSHVPPQPLPHARVALAHPLGRCGGEPLGPGLLRERVPHVGVLDRLELGASCGRACGGRSVRHK